MPPRLYGETIKLGGSDRFVQKVNAITSVEYVRAARFCLKRRAESRLLQELDNLHLFDARMPRIDERRTGAKTCRDG